VAVDITERTQRAMVESDILIWVLEYDRFTDLDESIYKVLRSQKNKNFIILANKADNENQVMEAYSLAGK
jgi:predicted GTPase